MNNIKENMKKCGTWLLQTSTLIGLPVVMILMLVGMQKIAFTMTCYTVDYKCEHAFIASDSMYGYVEELMTANNNYDLVVKPKNRK